MHDQLKRAIARISVGNKPYGTGFLVRKDPPVVATAFHVLANTRVTPYQRYGATFTLRFGDPRTEKTPFTTDASNILAANVENDWALLQLDKAPPCEPIPALPLRKRWIPPGWMTYGFPNDAPEIGLVCSGHVEDIERGQIYCHQAAAGTGAQVSGLSGSPCVVDGRVVGILTDSLMDAGSKILKNAAGSLFYTSIAGPRDAHPELFENVARAEDALVRELAALFATRPDVLVEKMAEEFALALGSTAAENRSLLARAMLDEGITRTQAALERIPDGAMSEGDLVTFRRGVLRVVGCGWFDQPLSSAAQVAANATDKRVTLVLNATHADTAGALLYRSGCEVAKATQWVRHLKVVPNVTGSPEDVVREIEALLKNEMRGAKASGPVTLRVPKFIAVCLSELDPALIKAVHDRFVNVRLMLLTDPRVPDGSRDAVSGAEFLIPELDHAREDAAYEAWLTACDQFGLSPDWNQ